MTPNPLSTTLRHLSLSQASAPALSLRWIRTASFSSTASTNQFRNHENYNRPPSRGREDEQRSGRDYAPRQQTSYDSSPYRERERTERFSGGGRGDERRSTSFSRPSHDRNDSNRSPRRYSPPSYPSSFSYPPHPFTSPPRLPLSDPRSIDARLPTEPALPRATAPIPTLAQLSPGLTSSLRIHLMRTLARPPSETEMEAAIPPFIARKRTEEAAELRDALKKVKLRESKREALDKAWMWSKEVEENSGVVRSELDREMDAKVQARMEERRVESERRMQTLIKVEVESLRRKKGMALPDSETVEEDEAKREKEKEKNRPEWKKHRDTMKEKFPAGWAPPKRVSREAIDLIRLLQKSDPVQFTTPKLADRFQISPEAVRRILKSQFELPQEELERREQRRKEERILQQNEEPWAGDLFSEREEMLRLKAESKVRVQKERR